MLQLNSYVKYPASSSYHLTRLVFMKTSSPRTFNAFLILATTRRCSFATGGIFSNSRALLQFTATLTTMLLTRDARKGDHHSNGVCRFSLIWQWYCFQEYMSTCSIVMSVHITHQYLSECRAVKYPCTACYQAKARNVFLCICRLSSTMDNCGSNVASGLSDSK